jgi:hypothetical protein
MQSGSAPKSFAPSSSDVLNMTPIEFEKAKEVEYHKGIDHGEYAERRWLRSLACQECKDTLPIGTTVRPKPKYLAPTTPTGFPSSSGMLVMTRKEFESAKEVAYQKGLEYGESAERQWLRSLLTCARCRNTLPMSSSDWPNVPFSELPPRGSGWP